MSSRFKDEIARDLKEDDLEFHRDYCGISAAIHLNKASRHATQLAQAQNHRGDKGVGIVSNKEGIFIPKYKFGTVSEAFKKDFDFEKKLPGNSAAAHTRYATVGFANDYTCLQPIVVGESKFGPFTILHNGQLVENEIRSSLLKNGAIFSSTSDSSLIPHIIAQAKGNSIIDGITHFMNTISTAYSLIIQTPNETIAVRDRFGVRPLHYAKMSDGWLVASETSTFRTFIDAKYEDSVKPGEIVIFKNNVPNSTPPEKISVIKDTYMPCIFERIYFSEPRSSEEGKMHEEFRRECGRELVKENVDFFSQLKKENAILVPILDSGKHGSLGVKDESLLDMEEFFMRRHNVPKVSGRSYTQSTDEARKRLAYGKLDLLEESVKDKVIVTVDDSLVRSTTAKIFNQRLSEAGAKKILNVVVSPIVKDICFLGMNHQNTKKLAYTNYKTTKGIAQAVGADAVVYLSTQGLQKAAKKIYGLDTFCAGCFGLTYPVEK